MGATLRRRRRFFLQLGWVADTLHGGRARALRRTSGHIGWFGQTGCSAAHAGSFLSPGPQALPGFLCGPRCPGHQLSGAARTPRWCIHGTSGMQSWWGSGGCPGGRSMPLLTTMRRVAPCWTWGWMWMGGQRSVTRLPQVIEGVHPRHTILICADRLTHMRLKPLVAASMFSCRRKQPDVYLGRLGRPVSA